MKFPNTRRSFPYEHPTEYAGTRRGTPRKFLDFLPSRKYPMNRSDSIHLLQKRTEPFDIAVIGGGSSGFGVALEALSRGLSVALFDKNDFGKGTSSRSTKLLHGGVRYLAQGDIRLVYEALEQRGNILKAAPHLTSVKRFVIPIYSRLERLKYTAGLKVYDLMSGRLRIGRSRYTTREDTLKRLPGIEDKNLIGGVIYHDGQFDDIRLLLSVARTCADAGAAVLNYAEVTGLMKTREGKVAGVRVRDRLSGEEFSVKAKMTVNATGVFADSILQMDVPGMAKSIRPSQGVHLVLDADFLGGTDALMIPETSDGRVLFAVPWEGKLIVGTTDTLRDIPEYEPGALTEEVDFILETAGAYLRRKPLRSDVRSVFTGLRPLAAPKRGDAQTKEISRSHRVIIAESNLVSIVGGKWTTFRKMGKDTVEAYAKLTGKKLPAIVNPFDKLHGYAPPSEGPFSRYGTDADEIKSLMKEGKTYAEKLSPGHPFVKAEIIRAVRKEMAVTVEDVLSRRMRLLILDARAARAAAPETARIMAEELGKDPAWIEAEIAAFNKIAEIHILT